MNTIRYQTISRYEMRGEVGEYTTGTRYFRSKERALKAVKKLKEFFGNAELITLAKNDYGYELISVEKI
jgi:hypothetical protein